MIDSNSIRSASCDQSIFLEFQNPVSKIDFITLPLTKIFDTTGGLQPLEAIKEAGERLCFPKAAERTPAAWNPYNDFENDWVTIHDPAPATLAYLVEGCPSVEIRELEVALDYFLADGTNDRQRLERLHAHIAHSLAPGRFVRSYFDPSKGRKGKYVRDRLQSKNCGKTVIWEGRYGGFRVKIKVYIKVQDNGTPIDRHSVRLEITLGQGATAALFNPDDYPVWHYKPLKTPTEAEARQQKQARKQFLEAAGHCPARGSFIPVAAGRFTIGMLPQLIKNLRTELTPFLRMAEGIKPLLVRTRSTGKKADTVAKANANAEAKALRGWQDYGAMWAQRHGLTIKPNVSANDGIGEALRVLQRRIERETAKKIRTNGDLG